MKIQFLKKLSKSTQAIILVCLGVLFLSLGYASFRSCLNIQEIAAHIRINSDLRVIGVSVNGSTNSGVSKYEDYNTKSINFGVTLPNQSSTVEYKVKVANFGNVRGGVLKIYGLPDNLQYTLRDYNLKSKFCDSSNNCISGMEKEFYVTIGYKEGQFNAATLDYNVIFNFDFQPIFTLSFNPNNGDTSSHDKEVMLNDSYGTLFTPTKVGHTFKGWFLNSEKIVESSIVQTESDHTLKASWETNKYDVTVSSSNTNLTNPTTVEVAYSGTSTISVKPNDGYYLSAVSCSTGYSTSGYTVGTSATGQQSITIKNNNQDGNGTCTITTEALAPRCSWTIPNYIRTNETAVAVLNCTSPVGFSSTSLNTSSFTSSNVSIARVSEVALASSTSSSASYNVTLRGFMAGKFNVSLNANTLAGSNGSYAPKTTSNDITVVGFEVNSTSVSLNLFGTRTFQIEVSGGNYGNVTYQSSNTGVATVSASGLIQSVAAGSTTITVKESKYNLTRTINVSVSNLLVVNYELTNMKSSNTASTCTYGSSYSTTLAPVNTLAYGRPSTIQVYINNVLSSNYTYNNVNGNLSISSVTGDLRIVAVADVLSTENISATTAKTIDIGNSTTVTTDGVSCTQAYQARVFKFIPKVSGTYTIYSTDPVADTNATDPYAYLFEESASCTVADIDAALEKYANGGSYSEMQSLSINFNDDGGNGYNFSMTQNLTAGKTYYIAIRTYTPSKIQSWTGFHIEKTS